MLPLPRSVTGSGLWWQKTFFILLGKLNTKYYLCYYSLIKTKNMNNNLTFDLPHVLYLLLAHVI